MERSWAHIAVGLLLLWAGTVVPPAHAEKRTARQGQRSPLWRRSLRDLALISPADSEGHERARRAANYGRTDFSAADVKKILAKHNNFRSSVSPGAADMRYMTWDADLATMAQGWADGCRFEHGQPGNPSAFQEVGQNIYATAGKASKPPLPGQYISFWHSEVADYDYNTNGCRQECGHYKQVVWAETHKVGCGKQFCSNLDGRGEGWFIVCNYGPAGNFYGQKPYISGDTCSKCPDEGPFCSRGLCDDCNPRSDSDCVCAKRCKNCATLDETRCECDCPNGFQGSDCGEECRDTHEYCNRNPGWPDESFCDFDPMVPVGCPLMCGQCKAQDRNYSCANPNGSSGGSRPVTGGGAVPKPKKNKKKKKKGKKNKKKGRGKKKGRRPKN